MVITILIKHPRPKFSTCFLDLIIMEKFKAHFKSAAGILMCNFPFLQSSAVNTSLQL